MLRWAVLTGGAENGRDEDPINEKAVGWPENLAGMSAARLADYLDQMIA